MVVNPAPSIPRPAACSKIKPFTELPAFDIVNPLVVNPYNPKLTLAVAPVYGT